jgi:hypothetical protein
MKIEKILIWFTAAVFLAYGFLFALFPGSLSNFVTGSVPASSTGLTDMRATYGGMSISVGVLMFLLGANERTIKLGLLSVIVVLLAMALTRTLGMIVDGSPNQMMNIYLLLEVIPAAVAIVLYRKAGSVH